MSNISLPIAAGLALKHLIQERYTSQQAFAENYGLELRTVSRYVTRGISKMVTAEEIADFFGMDWEEFLRLGKTLAE